MCTYFKTNWCSPKSNQWFFSTFVRGSFHRKDFKGKEIWGTGLISEKIEALYAELNKRAEATTSKHSATGNFLQYSYSVFVTKNHQQIQSRCLVHDFSFTDIVNDIMIEEQLYWRRILCGCFRLIWLWLLISIMKRCAEQCALQLCHTSLTKVMRSCAFFRFQQQQQKTSNCYY